MTMKKKPRTLTVLIGRVNESGRRFWFLADERKALYGRADESPEELEARWRSLHGPFEAVIRFRDEFSPAEAAATIADHQGA